MRAGVGVCVSVCVYCIVTLPRLTFSSPTSRKNILEFFLAKRSRWSPQVYLIWAKYSHLEWRQLLKKHKINPGLCCLPLREYFLQTICVSHLSWTLLDIKMLGTRFLTKKNGMSLENQAPKGLDDPTLRSATKPAAKFPLSILPSVCRLAFKTSDFALGCEQMATT